MTDTLEIEVDFYTKHTILVKIYFEILTFEEAQINGRIHIDKTEIVGVLPIDDLEYISNWNAYHKSDFTDFWRELIENAIKEKQTIK